MNIFIPIQFPLYPEDFLENKNRPAIKPSIREDILAYLHRYLEYASAFTPYVTHMDSRQQVLVPV